jgi:hypothetical protein
MEKMKTTKENLKELGFITVDSPIFYWNGNCVTKDETAPVKQVGTMSLKNQTFKDIIDNNKDKKIVIYEIFDDEIRLAIL